MTSQILYIEITHISSLTEPQACVISAISKRLSYIWYMMTIALFHRYPLHVCVSEKGFASLKTVNLSTMTLLHFTCNIHIE